LGKRKLLCRLYKRSRLEGNLAATQAEAPSVIQIRGQDILPENMSTPVIEALRQFEPLLETGALVTVNFNRAKVRILPIAKSDSLA
jgi:hypothetical protein